VAEAKEKRGDQGIGETGSILAAKSLDRQALAHRRERHAYACGLGRSAQHQPMSFPLPLHEMSREEKLRIMEALWEDLSRDEKSFESPAWHQRALEETEARIRGGQEKPLEWTAAKKELLRRIE
jgi:hypothetical protein